ncbi:MAG: hypothetical protein AB7L71_09435 [Vicinamibacterales bacterium]
MGGIRPLVALTLSAGLAVGVAAQTADRAQAARARTKVEAIIVRSLVEPAPKTPLRTTLTDTELNAYFQVYGAEELPTGLSKLHVTLLDAGRFQTIATIDFDALRGDQPRGMFDPMAYVSGTMALTTAGAFSATAGRGVLQIESGTLGGVTVPRPLLEQVVSYFSKSPDFPDGITLGEPFDLPSGIREVHLRKGSATVVQ